MKLKLITLGAVALSLATSAFADVDVTITGATAFRAATLLAINAKFLAESSPSFKFAHDKPTGVDSNGVQNWAGSTRSIWIGNFPGVVGTTTIRCCFTGSVEGIRAVVGAPDTQPPTYYQPSLLSNTTASSSGTELANQGTTGADTAVSDIAFSDVTKSSTPYGSYSLKPTTPAAGVIVFTMLTNDGSPITNVTTQQFKALLTQGYQPRSMFTGNPAHTSRVFVTGRNDGSGTRTTYLAESGFGITKPVKQYVSVDNGSSAALQAIQAVPAGGTNDTDLVTAGLQLPVGSAIKTYDDGANTITQSTSSASTIWGQDVAGNGGYNSGGTLVTDMAKTGSSGVTVFTASGSLAFTGTHTVDLVTWLSVNDAATARAAGAVFCAYNGVKLDGIAAAGTTMTADDIAKVTEGVYTAWGYENMYYRNAIADGSDEKLVFDGIKAAIPSNLASAGIALTSMHVARSSDGGLVAPSSGD